MTTGTIDTPLVQVRLSTPSFGWRERVALWRGTGGRLSAVADMRVKRLEMRVAASTGASAAMLTSSGTAALYLALSVLGVGEGDDVLVPTLAPYAVLAPILWRSARPLFVDVDPLTGTIEGSLVTDRLVRAHAEGRTPKALIAVDLYGQACDYRTLTSVCTRYGVPIIEDASNALGGTWRERPLGGLGTLGIVSFGANKTVSMGGGGALVSNNVTLVNAARRLATTPTIDSGGSHCSAWRECGMSPFLAPIGAVQIERLDTLVSRRRQVAQRYQRLFQDIPGLQVLPDAEWGRSSRWLTVVTVDETRYGRNAGEVHQVLGRAGVESRWAWTPLHTLAEFSGMERVGGTHAERLASSWLCLPSGHDITEAEQRQIARAFRACANGG